MVKDKHKFDRQSERRDSGENVNINIACELLIQTGVRGCSENTPVVSNINTNTNNSSLQQINSPISLTVCHQNIRGLRGKVNELLSQSIPTFPRVLCFSEHHMNQAELQHTFIDSYNLGVSYCRTSHVKGGVCIFVQDGLRCTSFDLPKYCKDKDFEACACKIYLSSKRICIIAIYRAPSGNFDMFFTKLDNILKHLYTPTLDLITVGDININYLVDSTRKRQKLYSKPIT